MKNRLLIISTLLAILLLSSCVMPSWVTYTNATYGFQLQYPSDGSLVTDTPMEARIQLPFQQHTNLVESYLDIQVQEGAMPCLTPYNAGYEGGPGELTVVGSETIGGEYWTIERGSEGAAGSIYTWVAYSTMSYEWACVSLTFVLHSTNPAMIPTSTPTYSAEVEEILFEQIVETFEWTLPTITPYAFVSPTPTVAVIHLPSTDTPTPSPFNFFIPKFNAYCYKGPDPIFGSISFAIKGESYPIDGRNKEDTWLRIMLTEDIGCWVSKESGTSGDTSDIRVLEDIPTPTFTPVPLNCSQFTSPQTCAQHAGCTWNRLVKPEVCENK
jgi:hypothetical protein